MKKGFHPAKFFFFVIAAIAFILLVGGIVMLLWNAILPDLLGVNPIAYWQAVGLLVLCRILFGRFSPGGPKGRMGSKRAYWKEKWKNMSDEERAAMKEKWKKKWGK